MDSSHPIPQDVTGFQFKLIGSITVKQFVFLLVPGVMDWILYYAPLLPFYIKFPLILLLGVIGVALAFLPVEGRPLDLMLRHFFSALFAPNQYIYQKTGQQLAFTTLPVRATPTKAAVNPQTLVDQKKTKQLQSLLQFSQPETAMDEKELELMRNIGSFLPPVTPVTPTKNGFSFHLPQFPLKSPFGNLPNNQKPVKASLPLSNFKKVDIGMSSAPTPAPVQPAQRPALPPVPPAPLPAAVAVPAISLPTQIDGHDPSVTYTSSAEQSAKIDMEKQLQQLQSEKKALEKALPQQPATPTPVATMPAAPIPTTVLHPIAEKITPPPAVSPTATQPVAKPLQPGNIPLPEFKQTHVSVISKDIARTMGLPTLPETPNLVAGIVRDARGNALPNILAEVKDKDGNPVRAFKTNQLGQFVSATPLNKGVYTLIFEDPRGQHSFDAIKLEVKGEVLSLISITSHDAREALKKELFG